VSKKKDILDSLYNRTSSMVEVGGYNYDWSPKYSMGNGSLPIVDNGDALLSVRLMPETSSQEAGQGQYWLTMMVRVYGLVKYDITGDVDETDYNVEATKAMLLDDLRRAFGLPWEGFCTAGGDDITYFQEIPMPTPSKGGHRVEVCGEWRIKWRDSRI